jgi:hypothetical protein
MLVPRRSLTPGVACANHGDNAVTVHNHTASTEVSRETFGTMSQGDEQVFCLNELRPWSCIYVRYEYSPDTDFANGLRSVTCGLFGTVR